jgi:hypothetical protein
MHPERVVIARVFAVVVTAVVATTVVVVVPAAIGAFGSLLLGHLFPIIQIIIISSGGCPRAQAAIIGIVAPPLSLGSGDTSL